MTTPIRNIVYFSDLLAIKYVYLIFRLKVYVACTQPEDSKFYANEKKL